MTGTDTTRATRYLYLVRHGEALPDESGLSEAGRRQATLLGRRLRGRPITVAHHSPLPRAAETAQLITAQTAGVELRPSDSAGDYYPYLPERSELPPESADRILSFLSSVTPEERDRGAALARRSLDLFTGPVAADGDGATERHELLVTHSYLVGWLVAHALSAPPWRWVGIHQANAGLTVIRYAADSLPYVLVFNDLSHLPDELRWTGVPAELQA
ncbi:MAG TPA: histidine phosphatase family protein [Actinocrinis sp.]|nr:histidine phosphatase family protein [Actinocrinis sp.]